MSLRKNKQREVSVQVKDPRDYRIGDLVLFQGRGPGFQFLSWLLARFDPAWRELRKACKARGEEPPWHMGFLSKYYVLTGTWYVSEARGGVGITETDLSTFKEPYLVFRWFDTQPDAVKVNAFIRQYRGEPYDSFWGYVFVIIWYFWSWWPLVWDHAWMCWEWVWFFCLSFGKPVSDIHKYPLITLLLDKIHYPGY